MKPSSDPAPVDRRDAWGFLITNLLVFPGAGSLLAGRRVEGVCQIILASIGMILTVVWFSRFVYSVYVEKGFPADPFQGIGTGLTGIGVFAVSMGWSAITVGVMLRRSGR
jgi:TM2 domain-containing membrane protein YozV